MREFIYYSRTAPTAGGYVKEDLHESGRLDIAIHTVIAAFFLSHKLRDDVKLHLIFAGPPDTPKHLELKPQIEGRTGVDKIYFSKRDVGRVIKKMLYKAKKGERREVYPGFFIEDKGILELIKELVDEGKEIYLLDKDGEDIRKAKIEENPIFVMGDHRGLPLKEFKRLKKMCKTVSIGNKTYFASHTTAIINNEIDRREEGLE